MITTLKFKLPEEETELFHALCASKAFAMIEDYFSFLRQKLKYDEISEEQRKSFEECRFKMVELMNEYNLYRE